MKIQEILKTRTCAQIRSHAQKFIIKLCKKYQIKIKSKKFKTKQSKHLNFVYKKKIVNPRPIDPEDLKFLDIFNYYKREVKIFLIEKHHKNHEYNNCPLKMNNIQKEIKNSINVLYISKNMKFPDEKNFNLNINTEQNSCFSNDFSADSEKFIYDNQEEKNFKSENSKNLSELSLKNSNFSTDKKDYNETNTNSGIAMSSISDPTKNFPSNNLPRDSFQNFHINYFDKKINFKEKVNDEYSLFSEICNLHNKNSEIIFYLNKSFSEFTHTKQFLINYFINENPYFNNFSFFNCKKDF